MIGRTIGKYRISGQLGRGGSGIVYRAVDETLNREVAIKVLNPRLAGTDVMQRFRAEATTLAKLNHPGIATIFELVHAEDELLMVMEFVRGETLDAMCDRAGPLPPEQAARIVSEVLTALDYAHRAGIVHRDVKPANIMVTDLGGVKIMDFGIARVRGAEHMTLEGSVIGTPAYMAPEQVLGEDVDARADLYAVGVVLYRLLTGALPFESDNPVAVLQKQISDAPAPLHRHREDLPDWCEAVVQRALAKGRDDRFQSAGEFLTALPGVDTAVAAGAPGHGPAAPVSRSALASMAAAAIVGRATAALRTVPPKAASAAALGAVMLAALAYIVPQPSATDAAAVAPERPLAFRATALVPVGGAHRERKAQLLLAGGQVTLEPDGGASEPLYAIPYERIESISYSHSRHPMWNAPEGPERVVRSGGGTLGRLGVFIDRHWISLRTADDESFVVFRVDDEVVVSNVLSALEQRTGVSPERVTWRP